MNSHGRGLSVRDHPRQGCQVEQSNQRAQGGDEPREVTRLHVRLALFSPNAEYLPEPVGLSWLPGEVRRFAWFTVTLESKVSVDAAFRRVALVGRHSLRPWCRALEYGNLL